MAGFDGEKEMGRGGSWQDLNIMEDRFSLLVRFACM